MIKQDEELLQKQRSLILQAAGDGVYGIDTDGNTTFSNPAAERLTGYTAEEMYGKPSHALIHHTHADGSNYPNYECPIYAAFNDGKVHRVKGEVFWRKDGTSFPVEYVSTPILDEGKIVGAVVAFHDVTQQKAAEDALRESEERYRKIVEATHDLNFLIRADDGAILDANEETCRVLGYSREEILGKKSQDIHGHQIEEMQEFLDGVITDGRGKSDKITCVAQNGERIPVLCSASLLRLNGVECVLIMAQDMREAIKAKKRTSKLQSDLSHGSRLGAMGEMASGMAHELNQPLTAVLNYLQACQLILESGDDDQKKNITKYMGKAIAQAERAGKIITSLRTFVQKGDADRQVENLNEIVEEASMLMLSGATTEDIDFQIKFAQDPPEICVDKIQIQQVVFNLVRNAVEALGDACNSKLIVTTSVQENKSVQVSVCDNGPGVDEDLLKKLFSAFTTTKSGGMGVGLSISQSIIEDHGGTLRAARNPDGGMTFTFTLPTLQDTQIDA